MVDPGLSDPGCVAVARLTERAWPVSALGGARKAPAWLPVAAFGALWSRLATSWHPCGRLVALLWPLAWPRAAWINGSWGGGCHERHSQLPRMAWINGFPGIKALPGSR